MLRKKSLLPFQGLAITTIVLVFVGQIQGTNILNAPLTHHGHVHQAASGNVHFHQAVPNWRHHHHVSHQPTGRVAVPQVAQLTRDGHHHHVPVPVVASEVQPFNYAPTSLAFNDFVPTSAPSSSTSRTVEPPMIKPINLTELCMQQGFTTSERQLSAYVSSIEAVTGTMQELDEFVQQIKPKTCEPVEKVTVSMTSPVDMEMFPRFTTTTTTAAPITVDPGSFGSREEMVRTTTESFLDPSPVETWSRAKRDQGNLSTNITTAPVVAAAPSSDHFGMPNTQDLAKASSDLRSLSKDLSNAADWLRQTNHNVHSALLRALVTYVSSIERRIESQRQLYVAQARMAAIRAKIAVVKEKMTALLEKLRSIISPRDGRFGNRADDATVFATTSQPTTAFV